MSVRILKKVHFDIKESGTAFMNNIFFIETSFALIFLKDMIG